MARRPYPDGRQESFESVASHEVSHTLGLRHVEDPKNPIRDKLGSPYNLMRAVPRGTQINVFQIREIQRLYNAGKLNQ